MAVSQSQPTETRPSFYATTRLARLVLHFRERLKSKIKIRHSLTETFGRSEIKSFKACAYKDLDRPLPSHDDSRESAVTNRKYGKNPRSDLNVSELLSDLDSYAKPGQLPLSAIAAEDQLFLEHDIHHYAGFKSTETRNTLDLTTLLLARLHQLQGDHLKNETDDLNLVKYNANLEHLLRCLQQAALEALIRLSLKLMEAEALRWNNYRRRLAQILDGWFAEWPNGQHPLSTTWPWNIKPSLVILWGVCWMFYADNDAQMLMPNEGSQLRQFSEGFRPRQVPLPITGQHDAGTWAVTGVHTSAAPSQWLQQLPAENDTRPLGRANNRNYSNYQSTLPDNYAASVFPNPYISSPIASSDRFSDPLSSQPDIQGSIVSFPTSNTEYPFIIADWPSISQSQAFSPSIGTATPGRQIEYLDLNVPSNQQTTPILQSSGSVSRGDMQGYPSPGGSDCSRQPRSSCPPLSPNHTVRSPGMPPAASPTPGVSPPTRQEENRKSLEPTKNAEGKIYCAHPACADRPPVFSRKCEWSKHMDKHTRPYICEEPGCEKIQGFTYSGGLLRHQREVHRQHGGPKVSCMCPFRDCKRSTGVGFSRKENLSEHLRRVHRGGGEGLLEGRGDNGADVQYQPADLKGVVPVTLEPTKRRKRVLDYPDDERGVLVQDPQKRRRALDYPDDDRSLPLPDPQKGRRAADINVQTQLGQPQSLQQKIETLTRELHTCQDKIRKLEHMVEQMARAQHIHTT